MLAVLLLVAGTLSPAPSPVPTTLKTITRVKSSPLCTVVQRNVFSTIEGLRINDRLVAMSKPLLLHMGSEFEPSSAAGKTFDAQSLYNGTVPGGTHDTNPALLLDNQHLLRLATAIVHNLAVIDAFLDDPKRFPALAQTDDDKTAQQLKAQLQAAADQQRKNLNVLYGLYDTFSLQDLIAKGDGTQGAINFGGSKGQVSHNDQDVSFQDVVTGPERGRSGSPVNPTVEQDPAVSQAGTDLANNPMARIYTSVVRIQQGTVQAENTLSQTLSGVVDGCRQ
ncbi:MAG TPA: hypothetical protein VNF68_00205 [Candidatus Baltobacteraceae bacterium]|nr:hypothetical protein [Candidatus Baltobacteraceae bacterium]